MLSLLSISAFAQLKVMNNGQVQVGNTSFNNIVVTPLSVGGDIEIAYPINPVDTLASLYNSIYSDSGIKIGNGGVIELECENNVTLKGDTVSKGGHMTVKGTTVTLDKGFSIATGGTLSVNL